MKISSKINQKGVAIAFLIGFLVLIGVIAHLAWINKTEQSDVTAIQIDTSIKWDVDVPVVDAHYKEIELSQVKDNASTLSTNSFVITSGTVEGITTYPDGSGADFVLGDSMGHYILATICHACMSDFTSVVSNLRVGDAVFVKGTADTTVGVLVNSPNGEKIESVGVDLGTAPSFGSISLTGIKKVFTSTNSADTSNWETYTNSEFGFQLKFPPDWSGYKVTRHELQRSDYPDLPQFNKQFEEEKIKQQGTVYFNFSFKDGDKDYSAFGITAYPKAYWSQIYEDNGVLGGTSLGEKNGFVFSKFHAQEPPLDQNLYPLMNQVSQILSTFKFTGQTAGTKIIDLEGKYTIEVPNNFESGRVPSSNVVSIPYTWLKWPGDSSQDNNVSIWIQPYAVSSSNIPGKCTVSAQFDAGILSAPIFCEGDRGFTGSFTTSENQYVRYRTGVDDTSMDCTMNTHCPRKVPVATRYSKGYLFLIPDKAHNSIIEFFANDMARGPTNKFDEFAGGAAILHDMIIPSLKVK